MVIARNPDASAAPEAYHHGVEVYGDVRTLYIAGQIGARSNGEIPDGIEAQTRVVCANIEAVLRSADMSFADIVKSTTFLVNRDDRTAFSAVRYELTAGMKHASTLIFVAGLALPELLVEIEAIAVRPV